MTRTILTVGVLFGISVLRGQEQGSPARFYFQTFGPANGVRALDEGFNNRVVRGKPFSATEERRSLQILGDGTRIESNQMNRLFRDSEGRTRVEEMNGTATIFDPVTNMRMELNPATRTARRAIRPAITGPANLAGQFIPSGITGVTTGTTENLNSQIVNGVMAQGTRTTMTIPKGQIGNDREIKVVTERWVSNDLQMLIKSSNSDPRFGDSSYQLTAIVEREPDALLFQIPSGYTISEGIGRGGPGGRSQTPPGGGRSPLPQGRGGRNPQ